MRTHATLSLLMLLAPIAVADQLPIQKDNGPIRVAAGVELIPSRGARVETRLAMETSSTTPTVIPLANWDITAPQIGTFERIRTDRVGAAAIRVQPSATDPGNCFGFLEGPLVTVQPGTGAENELFVLEVDFAHTMASGGIPPSFRLRGNTEDFSQYTESGLTPGFFSGNVIGVGRLRMHFDRNRLTAPTQMRLFIDLLSAQPAEIAVDPNFEIQITQTRYYSTTAPAPVPTPGPMVSTAYMEGDGDLYAHVNGSTARTRLREGIDRFAFDGGYVIGVDDGRLYGWNVANIGTQRTLESTRDVLAAAVAGPYVIALREGGAVWVYNINTGSRREIVEDGANGVASAGDGKTLIVLDSVAFADYRVLTWDASAANPSLREILEDYDARTFRGRMTEQY